MFQEPKNDFFRAFFAIDPPKDTKKQIDKFIDTLKNQKKHDFIKWNKAENSHITIRFLGDITESQYQQIAKRLLQYNNFEGIMPFNLFFTKVFMFPNSKNPIALALKPSPTVELIKIKQTLEVLLAGIDLKEEKHSFIPHLTLGKFQKQGCFETLEIKLPKLTCEINDITLFRSESTTQGSIYIPLIKKII